MKSTQELLHELTANFADDDYDRVLMEEQHRECVGRVSKGIVQLDCKIYRWWDKIDLHTFNIGWMNLCVVGQVFGLPADDWAQFDEACDELEVPRNQYAQYGFAYESDQRYWEVFIADRKARWAYRDAN